MARFCTSIMNVSPFKRERGRDRATPHANRPWRTIRRGDANPFKRKRYPEPSTTTQASRSTPSETEPTCPLGAEQPLMACRLSIRPLAKRVVPTEACATPAGDIPAMNLRFQAPAKRNRIQLSILEAVASSADRATTSSRSGATAQSLTKTAPDCRFCPPNAILSDLRLIHIARPPSGCLLWPQAVFRCRAGSPGCCPYNGSGTRDRAVPWR
jgi:hypothetical protein